jgi:hypothetical protein
VDRNVSNHSSVYSDMYSLWMGLVPAAAVPGVWGHLASNGLEHIGVYGAWSYLMALAAHDGDGGEALLTALTKCDNYSWCYELNMFDATMTRESWTGGTMSHIWGASAVVGVVNGLLG